MKSSWSYLQEFEFPRVGSYVSESGVSFPRTAIEKVVTLASG